MPDKIQPIEMQNDSLVEDPSDERDLLYSDILGGQPNFDWANGFACREHGAENNMQDQNGSMSCVGQGSSRYAAHVLFRIMGKNMFLSAKWLYGAIFLPTGGAYLREAMKRLANVGPVSEESVPSYEKRPLQPEKLWPPTEPFMRDLTETPELLAEAKTLDKFSYRKVEGETGNIDMFACAVRDGFGALGGMTMSNEGACRPDIRPPGADEETYGHGMDWEAAGLMDIELPTITIGTKCLFTRNSWGDRYAIQEGRWKGLQAVPESYFTAGELTAVGFVKGIYMFNAWVLIPDETLTPSQKLMDAIKMNEGRLVMDSEQSGAMGWIKRNEETGNLEIREASPERVAEMVANYLIEKEGVGLPKEMWNEAKAKSLITKF